MKIVSSKKTTTKAPKGSKSIVTVKKSISLNGHRSLTVIVVAMMLFISVCVYFVNTVILTSGTDDVYRAQAESKAQLINFNTSLLKQAQAYSADANNTSLPAGRINPFTP